MLAMAVAMLCVTCISDRPGQLRGYVGLSASLIMATSAHLIGSIMVFAAFAYALLLSRHPKNIRLSKLIPAFALPGLVFLVLYLAMWQKLNQNTSEWWMPATSPGLLREIAAYVVGVPSAARFLADVQAVAPVIAMGIQAGLVALVLAFLFLGQWRRSLPFLLGAVFFWLPLLGYSLLVKPVTYYRTILPGLIPLIAFVAIHLATIRQQKIKLVVISGVVALNVAFAADWVANVARQPLETWQNAAEFLKENWRPDDIIVFYPNYVKGPIQYYWPDMPERGQFTVLQSEDIDHLQTVLDNETVAPGNLDSHRNFFLIVRWDLYVEKDQKTHRQLLSAIQSGTDGASDLVVVFVTYADALAAPQSDASLGLEAPLAQFETFFGPPLSTSKIGSPVWATYSLNHLTPGQAD
jgi:hypothetical protein